MEDALEATVENGDEAVSTELEIAPSTTLMEVSPGLAILFGEVPDGVELYDFDFQSPAEQDSFSTALGMLGSLGTIGGNLEKAAQSAKGVFRLSQATLKLLKEGAELTETADGFLGMMVKNGKISAQARFVPLGVTPAAVVSSIGPGVTMIALQAKLGEISSLVGTNIALTTRTLKTIRNEQWSELEGLAESVHEALREARDLDVITDTVWEPIAPSGPLIRKQLKLYRKNVTGHVKELGKLKGKSKERREYLEMNAEAIVFDAHALLNSLKTHAEYQALRAGLARTRSVTDGNESKVFDRITQKTLPEIEESIQEVSKLTESLVRELRIIAELPRRATMPITKKRKDDLATKLTVTQLLESIEPLAQMLHPVVATPAVPDAICAPADLDLAPYLNVLRWYLDDGEELRSVAFPYELGSNDLTGVVPAILAKRVDASWGALAPGRAGAFMEKFAASTFVAVTDRRIVTADPKKLLNEGELGRIHSLDDIQFVRPRTAQDGEVRPTIDVATNRHDIQWVFPDTAEIEQVDTLAAILSEASARVASSPARIESAEESVPAIES